MIVEKHQSNGTVPIPLKLPSTNFARVEEDIVSGLVHSQPLELIRIDPSKYQYHSWMQEQQVWFNHQFPWLFKIQAVLDQEGIQADYLDLAMISGDLWQFEYIPGQDTPPIPLTLASCRTVGVERIAGYYNVEQDKLEKAINPVAVPLPPKDQETHTQAPQERYKQDAEALAQWADQMEMLIQPSKEKSTLSSFGNFIITNYLAKTRMAAYLWVREHVKQAERLLTDTAYRDMVDTFHTAVITVQDWQQSLEEQVIGTYQLAQVGDWILQQPTNFIDTCSPLEPTVNREIHAVLKRLILGGRKEDAEA